MGIFVPVLMGLALLGSAAVTVPTLVVEWARGRSPEVVFRVDTPDRVVAISIDDGPSEATEEILEVLGAHGVRATFFVIGDHVRERPALARRMVEEGHELGHHMMADEPSIDLTEDAFRRQFLEMDGILEAFGGSDVFRPGSGWYDERMVEEAAGLGYRTVLGSVYPFDAHLSSSTLSTWYIRQTVSPGDILVLHEGPERGVRTAEVLRRILPELRRRGFDVVTVSELLARAGAPGPAGADGGR